MSKAALQDVATHIFFPPQLPQKAPSDEAEHKSNALLCSLAVESARAYMKKLPEGAHRERWVVLISTLKHMLVFAQLPMDVGRLTMALREMKIHDILALHVRAQNASIIIRKGEDETTFEAFEVCPSGEEVMSGTGKLLCSYPGPAATVPSGIASSPQFLEQLSSYLVQMDTEILDSSATTKKAGSTVREVRDTADPKYITTVLLGGILQGLGRFTDVKRITKRVADEILWHDAYKPWRRSPLWLVMRVTLQASLDDTHAYKSFLLFFMAHVLEKSLLSPLPDELLFVMKAKICRRLYKLGSKAFPSSFVIQAVNDVAEQVKDSLLSHWEDVQDAEAKSSSWEPGSFDMSQDTHLSLPDSRSYISRVLQNIFHIVPSSSFKPTHKSRLFDVRDFSLYSGDGLSSAISGESMGLRLPLADLSNSHVALADFELSVESHLETYVENVIRSGWEYASEMACSALISCHEQYLEAASRVYASNPEDESRMLLTIMELWVGIDRLVVAQCPLLGKYSPEIPLGFLDPLLLRRSKAIERANAVDQYIRKRHDCARSMNPSVFSDYASSTSFSVQYFDQSQKHRKLRISVRDQAQVEGSAKRAELSQGNRDYHALTAKAQNLSHEYAFNRRGCQSHSNSCEKCKLEKTAKGMSIAVHEWPLPPDSNSLENKMVVFELAPPPIISIWRSITFSLLFDIGTPASQQHNFSADPHVILENYSGLKGRVQKNSWNRVTLASTTKSFTKSHYRTVSFPTDESQVCVNNGLTFRLFDKDKRSWAAGSFSHLSIHRYCTPDIPMKSPYKYLQFAVAGTDHTSNQVVADQSDCPVELSLHEYTSFASLRCAPRLQWLNIAREIRTRSLTFSSMEVHTLLTQAAWQIGPLSESGDREWHAELVTPEFCSRVLHEFDVLLQSVRSNWREGCTVLTLILLASRIIASNHNPDVLNTMCSFLKTARTVTFEWLQELVTTQQQLDGDKYISEFQRRICDMAATCSATFDVDPHLLTHVLASVEDVSILVQCCVAVHDNSPARLDSVSADLRRILFRHRRFLHTVEPHLRTLLSNSAEGLDHAMVRIWPSYRREASPWQVLPSPNSRWMYTTTTVDSGRSQEVHYNILEGHLLIDGKPLGRLPQGVVTHENYVRIFGTKILDVVPATLHDMEFSTRGLVSGYEVSFALRGDNLTIKLRHRELNESRIWEYIPNTQFCNDLPLPLVRNYFHWIDVSTGTIEFRPKSSIWKVNPKNWHLFFSDGSRIVMRRGEDPIFLLDPHSTSSRMSSRRLENLESPEHLIMTVTFTEPSARVQAELPRYRLSFFLNDDLDLESQNIPGAIIDEDQSAGTLFGLRTRLVLRAKDDVSRMLPRSRRLIIPHGDVRWTPQPDGHHLEVTVLVKSSADFVVYHEYAIDDDLGCLRNAHISLKSKLYKAYLHAVTSHFLPDPLTGRTGTEEALADLHSAGLLSFQSLDRGDINLLENIQSLAATRTFYPPHKKVMQEVEWSTLPSLSQHPAFVTAAQAIIDYAVRLQAFHEDVDPIIPTPPGGHRSLLTRAAHRYSVLFPVDTPGLVLQEPSEDRVYLSRDFPDEEATAAVCRTSRLIQSPPESLAWTEHRLMDTLFAWDHIGPAEDNISLSYGPYWREPALARDWITLSNMLCHAGWSDYKKFQLTFSLSIAAYCSPNVLNLIPVMLALGTNPRLRDFQLPARRSYVLSDEYEPDKDRVRAIVDAASRSLEDTPASDLSMGDHETWTLFSSRKYSYYHSQLDSHSSSLCDMFMNQWPSEQVYGYGSHNMWFDVTAITTKVQDYFCSCLHNTRLRDRIELVERHLRGVPRRPHAPLGPSSSLPRYSPTPSPGPPNPSFVSLGSLLDIHRPEEILAPSQFFTNSRNRRPSRKANTESLEVLLSKFGPQGGSVLLKDYGESLESSRKVLLTQEVPTIPTEFPYQLDQPIARNRDRCSERIHLAAGSIEESLSPKTVFDHALSLAGLWPRLTHRVFLDTLGFAERKMLSSQWKRTFTSFARIFIEYQRSQRLLDLYAGRRLEELFKELDNASLDADDADAYPDWLLIQIDSNFLARPVQTMVAHKMIHPSTQESTVVQLNMGEGKSSVIVPFVSAGLANGQLLVRVVVLKALANQMFRLLVERFGGLVNRRIYYMPFSRGLAVNSSQVKSYRQLYEQCAREGGILVVQPEHILSYKLMGLDRLLSPSGTSADRAAAEELQSSQDWLNGVSRDILDESDEILHVRYQLIYTNGQQKPLENHPDRWTMTQQVFSLVQGHVVKLRDEFPDDLVVEKDGGGQFPLVRIVGPAVEEALINCVADDVLRDKLPAFSLSLLPDSTRRCARAFIIGEPIETQLLRDMEEACVGACWSSLLLLRGLLCQDTGILLYVLKHRRWRVDYGLDPRRSLLAVPYRAKDMPSLKAEFGHPDVAICLTCLSYYYSGLTKAQVLTCFELLFKMDNPALEYDSWVRIAGDDIPDILLQLSGVNPEDSDQVDRHLFPIFSRRYTVVDFYLSQVVFPKQAKEFPYKLTTSGWDLVERKAHVTTGFSGTKDNRYLLPTSISQDDHPSTEQRSTDALVLMYLLQPENNRYICTQGPSVTVQCDSTEAYLRLLIEQDPEVRVLLDVGAQMLELKNEELAAFWLTLRPDVLAVIFFTEDDELCVRTQDGMRESFWSSPYRHQMDKCLVYLDDAHTRGTDLKLPKQTRAAVTLGPKVTKDRLVQGCMRMRQLGNGQSVMFTAPAEVDRHIREASDLGLKDDVPVAAILRWAMLETCADIERHVPQWADQGLDHSQRSAAYLNYTSHGDVSELGHAWLRQEARTLQEMYGPSERASGQRSKRHHAIFAHHDLGPRLRNLGVSELTDTRMAEEQEREVEQELEQERQVERPPKAQPASHTVHIDVRDFVCRGRIQAGSSQFMDPLITLPVKIDGTHAPQTLLATRDFMTTVKSVKSTVLSDYMRPVNWIASRTDATGKVTLVIMSPHEVNELLPDFRKATTTHLHMYAQRTIQTMEPFSDLRFYCIPPLPNRWVLPQMMRIHLGMFAGQLYLDDYDTYNKLCAFLGLHTGFPDGIGLKKQSDGFVRQEDRPTNGGMGQVSSSFVESPVAALQELFSLRRKGMGFLLTHMGKILKARKLHVEDFD